MECLNNRCPCEFEGECVQSPVGCECHISADGVSDSPSIHLLEIHKCMDDMLVLCMPEEFDRAKRDEVAIRIMGNGGRLAYISNHLDALDEMMSLNERSER